MIGIENIQKVGDFVADMANIVGDVFEDGAINAGDLDQLIPAGTAVLNLKGIKVSELGSELKDFSPEERESFIARLKERFDIPQDKIEMVVEKAISIINRQALVVEDAISLFQEFKKPE